MGHRRERQRQLCQTIAARAAGAAADGRWPTTLTAHFLAAGRPGPATIDTRVVKKGRRFTTVTATMSDTTRPLLALLASFAADEPTTGDIERVDARPPDVHPAATD